MAYGKSRNEIYLADDFESVTVAGSAIGTTAAKASVAHKIFVTAETAEMRFRFDGDDPASDEGHVIDAGDTLELYGNRNIVNFLAIKTGGTSGVLKITYYGL